MPYKLVAESFHAKKLDAVDMFIEGQSIVNSHSQTPDASRKFDADALKIECACRTFRSCR